MTQKKWRKFVLLGILMPVAMVAASCTSTPDEVDLAEALADAGILTDSDVCSTSSIVEGQESYEVLYAANRSLYVGTAADGQAIDASGIDVEIIWQPDPNSESPRNRFIFSLDIEPGQRLDVELSNPDATETLRQHVFGLHPIDIGHPVDQPDPGMATPPDPHDPTAIASGGGRVAVIDVDPSTGGPYADHGVFIENMIVAMGAEATLFPMPDLGVAADGLFFDEAQVIAALGDVRADIANYDVVNMSLGTYGCENYGPTSLAAAVADFPLQVVASAGNDNVNQMVYPAALPNVIGVGSTTADGSQRSCFSNHGDWVDVWITGEEVAAKGSSDDVAWSGTSFAAPQIAAIVSVDDIGAFSTTDQASPGPNHKGDWKSC